MENRGNVPPFGKTGVPHLASVIACAGIILDAELAGKLTDDRPPAVPMSGLIDSLEVKVKKLYAMHADKNPKHHTISDSVLDCIKYGTTDGYTNFNWPNPANVPVKEA